MVELFGGIGAGLAAVLKVGVAVKEWIYVEKDTRVRKMAENYAKKLQEEYPELLGEEVIERAMRGTVRDVRHITRDMVRSWGHVDLLVAGWECQGVSRAGKGKGMEDPRGALLLDLLRIMDWIKEGQGEVTYLLEHLDLEGDLREPVRRVRELVTKRLGKGVKCDAARLGARAHRVRRYWQNVVLEDQLQEELDGVKRSWGRTVKDILEVGRMAAPVKKGRHETQCPCNKVGEERRAWPTLVTFEGAAGFRMENGKAGEGMVYDH
ncbi:unnamed protein product [Closterium sp. NIES-53]